MKIHRNKGIYNLYLKNKYMQETQENRKSIFFFGSTQLFFSPQLADIYQLRSRYIRHQSNFIPGFGFPFLSNRYILPPVIMTNFRRWLQCRFQRSVFLLGRRNLTPMYWPNHWCRARSEHLKLWRHQRGRQNLTIYVAMALFLYFKKFI